MIKKYPIPPHHPCACSFNIHHKPLSIPIIKTASWVKAITMNYEDRTIVVASSGSVQFYDLIMGKLKGMWRFKTWITEVAFSPDGKYLAASDSDGGVYVYEVHSGEIQQLFRFKNWILSLSFSSNHLLAVADGQSAKVYHAVTGTLQNNFEVGEEVGSVSLNANYRKLATVSKKGKINVWDLDALTTTAINTGRSDINIVSLSPSATKIAVGAQRGFAVWNIHENEPFLSELQSMVNALTFSPDERNILIGTYSKTEIWDIQEKSKNQSFSFKRPVSAVAYSSDGDKIAAGDMSGIIKIWDQRFDLVEYDYEGHERRIEEGIKNRNIYEALNIDIIRDPVITPYRILGVSENATPERIRSAYKELALKWHPDKHTGDMRLFATEVFKVISSAYSTLASTRKL